MPDLVARLRALPDDTLTALAFFSRLPVRGAPAFLDLRRSAGAWPLAGLILTLAPAGLFLLARALAVPLTVSAVLALALSALLTGGMHEDGLSDCADGFGGRASREAKLEIMRDSRLGTFGALALLFVVLLKVAALAAIGVTAWHAALALICAGVLSRAAALWHWRATLPARADGMAAAAGQPDSDALAVGALLGIVPALLLLAVFGAAALLALVLGLAATYLFSRLSERQIGGHTGDTIGAAQQLAEAFLLAGLSAASFP